LQRGGGTDGALLGDDPDALQQRMEKFNATMDEQAKKNPNMSQVQRDEAYKKALMENFTAEELKRVKGISNGSHVPIATRQEWDGGGRAGR